MKEEIQRQRDILHDDLEYELEKMDAELAKMPPDHAGRPELDAQITELRAAAASLNSAADYEALQSACDRILLTGSLPVEVRTLRDRVARETTPRHSSSQVLTFDDASDRDIHKSLSQDRKEAARPHAQKAAEKLPGYFNEVSHLLRQLAATQPADWSENDYLSAGTQKEMPAICNQLADKCADMIANGQFECDPDIRAGDLGQTLADGTMKFSPRIALVSHGEALHAIIHELTHASLGTKDVAYEHDPLLDRLKGMPSRDGAGTLEKRNADSLAHGIYQCAENLPPDRLGMALPKLKRQPVHIQDQVPSLPVRLDIHPALKAEYLDAVALVDHFCKSAPSDDLRGKLAGVTELAKQMKAEELLHLAGDKTLADLVVDLKAELDPKLSQPALADLRHALKEVEGIMAAAEVPNRLGARLEGTTFKTNAPNLAPPRARLAQ
ncbi:MAG TPA: hypothetical protein VD994_13455 [Prosthecobacter sp.]|nr:hypothetical protein [Prosthecobacter sp.]